MLYITLPIKGRHWLRSLSLTTDVQSYGNDGIAHWIHTFKGLRKLQIKVRELGQDRQGGDLDYMRDERFLVSVGRRMMRRRPKFELSIVSSADNSSWSSNRTTKAIEYALKRREEECPDLASALVQMEQDNDEIEEDEAMP